MTVGVGVGVGLFVGDDVGDDVGVVVGDVDGEGLLPPPVGGILLLPPPPPPQATGIALKANAKNEKLIHLIRRKRVAPFITLRPGT